MYQKAQGYQIAISLDLRVFDNREPDYGVARFLERLGYVPHYVFNHETYVGQIHSHSGVIDDTLLEPTWTSQRAMPGGQWWTRAQYKGLVNVLHQYGIRFFQGAEAAWSVWPEYGEISRDRWVYEHLSELFVRFRNGTCSGDEMGMINPLKHLRDGSWYEDRLLKDVLRFLQDYEMDGFFAADGFGGLSCNLRDGDFDPDMIAQFEQTTGIRIPEGTIGERADFIVENHLYDWAVFYSERWCQFYRKFTKAFREAGKELIVMAPFKHGPADALMNYGFDYHKSIQAGLDFLALESMENSSRRWQYTQAMEAIGISNVTTIKAADPNVRIFWMSSTCNCPEHWHALRDVPNALERECLALNTARAIGENGKLVKGFDGAQPLFGIDLSAEEWRWYKKRLDMGHMPVAANHGLVILWSQRILHENARRGIVYPLNSTVVKLRFAGLPIHTAVDMSNLRFVKNQSLLLVNPLGISDEDVAVLKDLVQNEGKNLIVVGEVEHPQLLALLGIHPSGANARRWRLRDSAAYLRKDMPAVSGQAEQEIGGYVADDAEVIIEAINERGEVVGAAVTAKKAGQGRCLFTQRLIVALPKMKYRRSYMDHKAHPNVRGNQEDDLLTTREVFQSLSNVHPDALELLFARLVQHADGTFAYSDKGQVLSFQAQDGSEYLLCENPLNMTYLVIGVTLPGERMDMRELDIRFKGPVGYAYYGDERADSFDVCVPPEAVVPFVVTYRKEGNTDDKEAKG